MMRQLYFDLVDMSTSCYRVGMVEAMEVHGMSQRELAAWRTFGAMRRRLDSELERRLQQDGGISAAEFEVLVALYSADDRRMRSRTLGESMGWEKSRVSHQVTRMQARGLVERVECADDLRGIWIGLTEQGREAVLAVLPQRVAAVRELFLNHLDDDELATVYTVSQKVLAATEPVDHESLDDQH